MLATPLACQPGTMRLGIHDALHPAGKRAGPTPNLLPPQLKRLAAQLYIPNRARFLPLSSSNIINHYKRQ
jgi:hypothetical protein